MVLVTVKGCEGLLMHLLVLYSPLLLVKLSCYATKVASHIKKTDWYLFTLPFEN